jgi:DNA-binding XRE family transcriptional regulator
VAQAGRKKGTIPAGEKKTHRIGFTVASFWDAIGGTLPKGGTTVKDKEPGKPKKKKPIRVPRVPKAERLHGLLPQEICFILEEIAMRIERHWTMDEVARRSGLQRQEIAHLEHWRRAPSYKTICKVASAFDMEDFEFTKKSRRWMPQI